jgi:DNA-binding response OmpR family regulator
VNDTPTVLYVDDGQDFLDAMRLVLEAHGLRMLEAHSAEEGLRVWRAHRPDFILIDLMMEEVDAGVGLARDLKARGNDVPVYMLSSVGDELNLNASLHELGVLGIFQKPLDHETLLATIRATVR